MIRIEVRKALLLLLFGGVLLGFILWNVDRLNQGSRVIFNEMLLNTSVAPSAQDGDS